MPAPTPSAPELEILTLSVGKFRWKTTGNLDAVADLFDDELVFVQLNGHLSTKQEWLAELRTGRFVYYATTPLEASAKVYGTTAGLVGKARFAVTMDGSRGTYSLVYTEVYTQKAANGSW